MAEDPRHPGDGSHDEAGEPVVELQRLRESPPANFLHRVRARIQTRLFAGQVLDFSVPIFMKTLMEYVSMVFAVFGENRPRKGEGD